MSVSHELPDLDSLCQWPRSRWGVWEGSLGWQRAFPVRSSGAPDGSALPTPCHPQVGTACVSCPHFFHCLIY